MLEILFFYAFLAIGFMAGYAGVSPNIPI